MMMLRLPSEYGAHWVQVCVQREFELGWLQDRQSAGLSPFPALDFHADAIREIVIRRPHPQGRKSRRRRPSRSASTDAARPRYEVIE